MKADAPHFDQPAGFVSRATLAAALRHALGGLDPRPQLGNPSTLAVYAGAVCATAVGFASGLGLLGERVHAPLFLAIAAWLWLAVLIGNLAQTMIERWSLARAAARRSMKRHVHAKRLLGRDRSQYHLVEAGSLRRGDAVLVEANDIIPLDGTVIEGAASVSEGAVTGESAPVLRSTDRQVSAVRGGSRVLSDWLVVRVRSREGFFDPMIATRSGTRGVCTAREIGLSWLLATAIMAFLIEAGMLAPFPHAAGPDAHGILLLSALIALLVALVPIATRALLAALAQLGVQRLARVNVVAATGRAVETAGEIDVLVLDKTGTITQGDRQAVAYHAAPGVAIRDLVEVAQLASFADATPEGRSIVTLAKRMFPQPLRPPATTRYAFHEFSAQTCISGVDLDGRRLRKGAIHAMRRFVEDQGGSWPRELSDLIDQVARTGATPLVAADGARVLGVIELRDLVKGGVRERCARLREMGVRTIMVTGDNRLTALAIAADIGVDDFLAEATPESKLDLIRRSQIGGHRVAMCGDGTNDAPALAQADLAVVMNTGTAVAKQVGDMVDLDSDPAKLVEIVENGRQIALTRRSLATFGIAAELAKYLVIFGAAFTASHPQFGALHWLRLTSAFSAILSAAIFSVLFGMILAPLAATAMRRRPAGAAVLPRRTLLLGGLGACLVPFAGIKAIDAGLAFAHIL